MERNGHSDGECKNTHMTRPLVVADSPQSLDRHLSVSLVTFSELYQIAELADILQILSSQFRAHRRFVVDHQNIETVFPRRICLIMAVFAAGHRDDAVVIAVVFALVL